MNNSGNISNINGSGNKVKQGISKGVEDKKGLSVAKKILIWTIIGVVIATLISILIARHVI